MLPGEADLRTEREAFMATYASLSEDEADSAETLCAGWAPRDVLAHMITIEDGLAYYLKAFGRISAANNKAVADMRAIAQDALLARGWRWARQPAFVSRVSAFLLLGDNAIHHQDVLRGLGRSRAVPEASSLAILREGTILGIKKLNTVRACPVDVGNPVGRGKVEIHGTAEALGMWLAGRKGVADEIVGLDQLQQRA